MKRGSVRGAVLAAMLGVTAWATVWSVRAAAQPKQPVPAHVAHVASGHEEGTVAAEERAAAKADGAEAEGDGPAPINWGDFGSTTPPFVAMLINFGLLIAGYYFLGRKPIAAALRSRRDSIAKEIEEAERMLGEARQRAKKYEAKHARLEEDKRLAREGLVRAGEAERDRLIAEAEAKAERMRKDAEFLVEQELKQVRADLTRETVEAAIAAAEELLKSRVTAADQERLADDFLTGLAGNAPAAAVSGAGPRQAS